MKCRVQSDEVFMVQGLATSGRVRCAVGKHMLRCEQCVAV